MKGADDYEMLLLRGYIVLESEILSKSTPPRVYNNRCEMRYEFYCIVRGVCMCVHIPRELEMMHVKLFHPRT